MSLRRLLPAVLLTSAALAVPGTASAAPVDDPVTASRFTSAGAHGEVALPDGRVASVSLDQYRASERDEWQGFLYVSLVTPCTTFPCTGGLTVGSTTLTDDQIDVDRHLEQASVADVPLTLSTGSHVPGTGYTRTEEVVTVSLTFTGTGEVDRAVHHGDQCGDGSTPCLNSLRREVTRLADVSLRLGDLAVSSSSGQLHRGVGIDVHRTPTGG